MYAAQQPISLRTFEDVMGEPTWRQPKIREVAICDNPRQASDLSR